MGRPIIKPIGGYCKINLDTELRNALIKAKINSDLMIGHHSFTYVPRWVKDAIAVYRKGQGFAGLSLEEFIVSMRPIEVT